MLCSLQFFGYKLCHGCSRGLHQEHQSLTGCMCDICPNTEELKK